MVTEGSPESIWARYLRACLRTTPKAAIRTPRALVEGYWLDERSYYFLNETYEPSLDRMVSTPTLIDCESGQIEELIPLDDVAVLLRDSTGQFDRAALSTARFDMPDRHTLVVSAKGRDHFIDWRNRRLLEVKATPNEPELYSPDGQHACFVRAHNIWLRDCNSGEERPLSLDGELHRAYGQNSETCLFAISDRAHTVPQGLWSPDSQWFLTQWVDERLVPSLSLVEHVPSGGARSVTHSFKYCLPGDSLPLLTLVAFHVGSGRMIRFDSTAAQAATFSPFFSRQVWFGGPEAAWFVRLDRYARHADLIKLDLLAGAAMIVLQERVDAGYIDLNTHINGAPNVRALTTTEEIVWFSERSGWGHLYLYDGHTGRLKNAITSGDWFVRDVVHVDELRREVLFLAQHLNPATDPGRRALCVVKLDGTGFETLLEHDGDVYVPPTEPCGSEQTRRFRPAYAPCGVSSDGRFAIVRLASIERGNITKILTVRERKFCSVIATTSPKQSDPTPRPFTALAADGTTILHGVMFLPTDFDENQRYALIDYIYPGPQIAWQPQSYGSLRAAQAEALSELGFITVMLDTRGMPLADRHFHQAGYGNLLEPQLADHAAVVRQLGHRYSFIDATRVGIIGQSGGGAAAARALFVYADVFAVGVAVCGNHNSNLYASVWSDKYRGPGPAESWNDQANEAAAHALRGKLLLVSGDMDENVLVSQTLALTDALIRANRDFDLLIVPNAGHGVLVSNSYVQRRIWDYFVRHLSGKTPPAGFEFKYESYELERLGDRSAREARF